MPTAPSKEWIIWILTEMSWKKSGSKMHSAGFVTSDAR